MPTGDRFTTPHGRRWLAGLGLAVGLALAVVWLTAGRAGQVRPVSSASGGGAKPATVSIKPAAFSYLSHKHSNRCDLQRAELMSYPDSRRLQGSCCFQMNAAAYRAQLRDLKRYARIPAIPKNPYDVPAALAKRLLHYQQRIHLSASQRATYNKAMNMSDEKGPCCCRCWRWDAFQGLSNYLIADRGWSASHVAKVIDLEEGCGGPAKDHQSPAVM